MSRKRSRDECVDDGWWNRAVAFVRKGGGKVHESLQLSPTNRELYVNQSVAEGEKLLVIPSSCLVSWKTVQCSSSLGRHITNCVQAVAKTTSSFYCPIQDLAIAVYLASISTRKKEETVTFAPYLDTLPTTSTFDALPRRWPGTQLQLLAGSPILDRVKRQKEGIQSDYNLIREMWKKEHLDDKEFPDFGAFSVMMAAVTSRAFAGFGADPNNDEGNHYAKYMNDNQDNDANIAMVPLLDLCNHSRGSRGHKNVKNIAYQHSPSDRSVIVTARETINAGESLRITYGARSNQQLLLNYGFCIEDNVEPDGSSNDVLEFYHFSVNDDQTQPPINHNRDVKTIIQLRAGPKAHAFHGFVNALDLFYIPLSAPSGHSKKEEDHQQDSERDDFEENEDKFDKWDMEMTDMGNDTDNDDDDGNNDESNDELRKQQEHHIVQLYVKSLDAFAMELNESCKVYYLSGEKLEHALALQSSDPTRHAALLVKSELRTVYFILLVIRRLQTLLTGMESKIEKTDAEQIGLQLQLSESDHQLLREQAVALSSAFLQIRLPFWKA